MVASIVILYIALSMLAVMVFAVIRRVSQQAIESSWPVGVPYESLGAGARLPELSGILKDGSKWSPRDLGGSRAVVALLSTTCAICFDTASELRQLEEEEPDLKIAVLVEEASSELATLRANVGPSIPIVSFSDKSEEFHRMYRVGAMPTLYLIVDGNVAHEAMSLSDLKPRLAAAS